MDAREFMDLLYAQWAKTTGAEKTYWQPTEHENLPPEYKRRFSIDAVEEDQSATRVAAGLSDEDSDWITALHGSFPDIYRRFLDALDEADRLDRENDENIGRIADLESEAHVNERGLTEQDALLMSLREQIMELKRRDPRPGERAVVGQGRRPVSDMVFLILTHADDGSGRFVAHNGRTLLRAHLIESIEEVKHPEKGTVSHIVMTTGHGHTVIESVETILERLTKAMKPYDFTD